MMKEVDLGIEWLRSQDLKSNSLTDDGQNILALASLILGSDIEQFEERSFVRSKQRTAQVKNIVAFATNSSLQEPAVSSANHIAISQMYASTIRCMCLRLWADSGFSTLDNDSRLHFPKQPRNEIPWGAELLWMDLITPETVPDWYEEALNSLTPPRRECFEASYFFALMFTLLHEIGHIKFAHHQSGTELDRHHKELEADRSAIASTFFSPHLLEAAEHQAKNTLLQMASGVIATFIVFHLLITKNSPKTAGQTYHQGYPTASERIAQLIRLLPLREKTASATWFREYTEVIRIILDVASLHPAFGYVMGTSWIGFGYSLLESVESA